MVEETAASAADVIRAYVVVREVFGLRELWVGCLSSGSSGGRRGRRSPRRGRSGCAGRRR
ncbi:hypothetical protein [Micromonospora sp. NPDC005173]|uniref:hypothetical protein n=1 Tax=Micromonospora sp. NPDC005173 TaxID=3157165 RepID=UPI0033A5D1C0